MAPAPVPAVVAKQPIMDLATAAAPVFAPSSVPASTPPPAGLMTPPPIGAPPVDLPGALPAAQVTSPVKAPTDNTLSFADITGGKQPGSVASAPQPHDSTLDDIPLLGSPMPEVPVTEAPATEAVAPPPVLVGDGQPLGDDPYANIDIMGAPAPAQPVAPGASAPAPGPVAPPPVPVSDGTPLGDDPYGQIDILGESRASAPAPVPITPAEVKPTEDLWPEPVLAQPAPAPISAPAPAPSPVAAPMPESQAELASEPVLRSEPVSEPPVQMEASVQPLSVQPETAALVLPEPEPLPAPMSAPMPMPVPAPVAQVQPVPVAAPAEPEPRYAEPEPRFTEPEPRSMPEPVQTAPVAPEPVAEPATSEPLIHFVDPAAAESLLNSPDVPEPERGDGAPSMSGLPEGVQLVQPGSVPAETSAPMTAAPLPPAPVVPASNEVPAAQADLAAKLSGVATTPTPEPVKSPAAAEPVLVAVGDTVKPLMPDEAKEEMEEARAHIAAIAAAPPKPLDVEAPGAEKPAELAEVKPEVSEIKTEVVKPVVEAPKPEQASVPAPVSEPVKATVEEAAAEPVKPAESLLEKVEEPAKPVEPLVVENAPEVESASVTQPKPMSGADQIQNVEHQIDDLLSVSLIHSDSSPSHHRLPDPITIVKSEDESGVDLELNAGRPSEPGVAKDEHPTAVHHGLKVIQPLEPIVPPKERFAKELAEMNAQQQPAPVVAAKKAPAPVAKAAPVVPPKPPAAPVAVVAPPAPKPEPPKPEPKPAAVQPAPAPLVMQAAPLPAPTFDDFAGLPQAQSLAANDVAKVRAEQAAHPAPAEVTAPVPEPELPPAPAPAAIVKHDEHMLPAVEKAEDKPEENKPETAEKPESEQPNGSNNSNNSSKRNKRRRGGREKPAERIESAEEAEHNQPSAAAAEAAPLTGTLILPSGEKPVMDVEKPKEAKPKKLAPGEVYVDDSGNVIIGE